MKHIFSSMTARLLTLLVGGLLVLQVVVFVLTVQLRYNEQFKMAGSDRARLAVSIFQLLEALPAAERRHLVDTLGFESFSLDIHPGQPFAQNSSDQSRYLRRRLHELYEISPLPRPDGHIPELITDVAEFRILWNFQPQYLRDADSPYPRAGTFEARAALPFPDGEWLVVNYHTIPALSGSLFDLAVELGIQFILQIVLALMGIRYVTRPLRRLGRFADSLTVEALQDMSRDALAGLPEHGPSEVVSVSRAMRAMCERIRHFVEERLRVLASLSHDLRTPLARLRLQLEAEHLSRPAIIFDALDDLEYRSEEAIALARTGFTSEPEARTDLVALLESLVADYEESEGQQECLESGHCRVSLDAQGQARCLLRPASFRRCLENLVENALRYGHEARIRLSLEPGFAVIHVDDSGPGIAPEHLEDVFQPFFRLEASRNSRTGGTGLGLGIARDLARQNHATLTLSNLPRGLRATLRVPLLDE